MHSDACKMQVALHAKRNDSNFLESRWYSSKEELPEPAYAWATGPTDVQQKPASASLRYRRVSVVDGCSCFANPLQSCDFTLVIQLPVTGSCDKVHNVCISVFLAGSLQAPAIVTLSFRPYVAQCRKAAIPPRFVQHVLRTCHAFERMDGNHTAHDTVMNVVSRSNLDGNRAPPCYLSKALVHQARTGMLCAAEFVQ